MTGEKERSMTYLFYNWIRDEKYSTGSMVNDIGVTFYSGMLTIFSVVSMK